MTGDKELLEYLKENIDMGLEALETLDKNLESTDNKIRNIVLKSLDQYKDYSRKVDDLLDGTDIKPKAKNLLSLLMVKLGSKTEFMRDNSDSKIAETLIQGYNMGIIDITKKIKKYKGNISKEVLNLATEYKDLMEHNIKEVKKFL